MLVLPPEQLDISELNNPADTYKFYSFQFWPKASELLAIHIYCFGSFQNCSLKVNNFNIVINIIFVHIPIKYTTDSQLHFIQILLSKPRSGENI